jgi:hypothetical protein
MTFDFDEDPIIPVALSTRASHLSSIQAVVLTLKLQDQGVVLILKLQVTSDLKKRLLRSLDPNVAASGAEWHAARAKSHWHMTTVIENVRSHNQK